MVFDLKILAEDLSINPSSKILKLLAFRVSPVEVISTIMSAIPLNGAFSVDPELPTVR